MYAIFMTGGKQYKVSAGDVLRIEKIEGNEGDQVQFESVLAFSDDDGLKTGTPYLDAATVNATITDTGKGKKIIIFKYKAKKNYRNKKGHRQPFTEIEVDNFTIEGKTVGEKPAKPVVEEEEELEAELLELEDEIEAEDADDEAPAEDADDEAPVDEDVDEEEELEAELLELENEIEAEDADDEAPADGEDEVVEADDDEDDAEESDADDEAPADEEDGDGAGEEDDTAEVTVDDQDAGSEELQESKAEENPAEAKTGNLSKLTKADIMAKLDELGVEYQKSAKKDELLGLLEGAEKK